VRKINFLIITFSVIVSTGFCASEYTKEQQMEMITANSMFENTIGSWKASNIYFVNNTGKDIIVKYNECEHHVQESYEFKESLCTSFDVLEESGGNQSYGLLHIDQASPDGAQYVVTYDPYRTKEDIAKIQSENEYFLKQLVPSRVQSFSFVNNTDKECLLRVNGGCEYKIGIGVNSRYEFPYRSEAYKTFEVIEGDGILHIGKASADGKKHIVTFDKKRSELEILQIEEKSKRFEDLFKDLGMQSFRFVNNTKKSCSLRINKACEYHVSQYGDVELPFVDPPYESIDLVDGSGILHIDRFSKDRTRYYVTLDPESHVKRLGSPAELTWNESFSESLEIWASKRIYFVNNTDSLSVIKLNDRCEFRIYSGYTYNFPERDLIYSSLKLLEGNGIFHIDTTSPDGGSHIVTLDPYRTPEEISEIQERNKDFNTKFKDNKVVQFSFKNNSKRWCTLRVNEGCEYKIGVGGEYKFPYKDKEHPHHSLELVSGDGILHMMKTSIDRATYYLTLDPDRQAQRKLQAMALTQALVGK
jgi:hypothetical protein